MHFAGDSKILHVLVRNGIDTDFRIRSGARHIPMNDIHQLTGQVKSVEILLSNGTNINVNNLEQTPLIISDRNGKFFF